MKHTLLPFLLAAAVFTGCSSAYKSSQTPDDVYYSPARAVKEHAYADDDDEYADNYTSGEDNYLRMKMRNRSRWATIDDYDYWNSPNYAFNNYYGNYGSYNPYFNNSWYSAYNSPFNYGYAGYGGGLYPSVGFGWYNAYYPSYGYGVYTPIYVVKTPTRVNTVSRSTYLGSYLNRNYNTVNTQGYNSLRGRAFTPSSNNGYNNSNSRRNTYYNFNSGRNNNNNNSNNNNSYTPSSSRSYTPSSSSSSSSHSSGSGSVSRPPR